MTHMKYQARLVSPKEWDEALAQRIYPLYYCSWWLSASKPLLYVCYENERPVALMSCVLSLKRITTPDFCQYTGLYFLDDSLTLNSKQEVERSLFEALPRHNFLQLNYPPNTRDFLGAYWLGYRQTTRFNYVLDIRSLTDEEAFRKSISRSLRQNLKAAERKNFCYKHTLSTTQLLDVLQQNAQYKGYKSNLQTLKRLITKAIERDAADIVGLCTENGSPAMVALFIRHQRAAYLIAEGTNRELAGKVQLKSLMLMHYIQQVKESIDFIDFEGSMIEPIARIYQALGATQQAYHRIERGHKYNLYYLIKRLLRP